MSDKLNITPDASVQRSYNTGMIVYLITNRLNGKHYVGQTVLPIGRRITCHKSHSRNGHGTAPLHAAIRKYGWENFQWEILENCEDQADLDMAERFWIRAYNSLAPNGYNRETGGSRRKGVSDETKEKIAASNRGKRHSDATKRLMSVSASNLPDEVKRLRSRKRKPLTDSHKSRLSELRSGERYATKLTWEKVREIRRLYATREYSQPGLAQMFDCGTTIIWAIVNNKKWIENA